MIVYVDLEHERARQDPARADWSLARRLRVAYRLEDISGEPCLIVRYPRVSPALLREVSARAVLVSGCDTDFEHYAEADLAGLRAVYRAAEQPTLGFCGGLQLMAQTFGAPIEAMPALAPGEADPYQGAYVPGFRQERGFMPVRVQAGHPWFDGLGEQPVVFEAHYWEVKAPPAGFRVLAESDLCGIQAMAHQDLPLFGTQFHPEAYDD
ncbi:MAG: gamma-glutamyl-gamma-aminobutyrate hydrolase family protein, partial [Anaerolineales bacterium]